MTDAMREHLAAVGALIVLCALLGWCSGCTTPREQARGAVLVTADAVRLADTTCAEAAIKMGRIHTSRAVDLAGRCADAYDVARTSLLVAEAGVDAWDDADRAQTACAFARASGALLRMSTAMRDAGVQIPTIVEDALRLAPLTPQVLLERLAQASAKATRAARRLIPFEADASPESSAVVADAAIVTAEAVVRLSRRPDGRNLLGRLKKVKLVEGSKPAVALHGSEMRITVSPDDGLAGRPSSDKIMQAAGAR